MSSNGFRKTKVSKTSAASTTQMLMSKKTLDTQHNNKMNEFQSKAIRLNDLKEQLIKCEEQLQNISKESHKDNLKLKDSISELSKEIESLEINAEDEIDYLVNTAPILFKYYDIIEKGMPDENIVNTPKVPQNSVLHLLMKHASQNTQDTSTDETKPIKDASTITTKEDRASLLEKYMSFTDRNFVRPMECDIPTKCMHCNSSNLYVHINDGFVCCNECSSIEYIIVDHERPSYKDPPREVSYFAYKRINHFNECLSQIQGKETTEIPDEVYDAILMEIKKQRITNIADLSVDKVREILKKLDLNKYYEHAPHIKHKLNGLPIPHLEPELEDKLRTMFKMIQQPFLKHMPPNRKNFLSYSYVLHKLIQLLEKDEYLENFSLLKSRDKLHQQDQIWKKICEDLNWQFIRSI